MNVVVDDLLEDGIVLYEGNLVEVVVEEEELNEQWCFLEDGVVIFGEVVDELVF